MIGSGSLDGESVKLIVQLFFFSFFYLAKHVLFNVNIQKRFSSGPS